MAPPMRTFLVSNRMGNAHQFLPAAVVVVALLVQVLPSAVATSVTSSPGFIYNGDAECSYPFSDFEISALRCVGSSGTYVQGYNDNDDQYYDDDQLCRFGDSMVLYGTTTLAGMAPKAFSVSMKVCFGGSDLETYDPQSCSSSRTTLDLNDYAMLKAAQYNDEEVEESEYYLQAGSYQWHAAFTIPKRNFYFSNGSKVQVFLTFYPKESYLDYPYNYNRYKAGKGYAADIVDSKYHTSCYASFDAIPVEVKNGYQQYVYRYAAAFLLFGVATYVTMKRKVICSCERDNTMLEEGDHYKSAEDDHYKSAEDDQRSIEDGQSICTR